MLSLRYYQDGAVTDTIEAFDRIKAALLCLATGSGKTPTAAELIRRLGVGRDGRTVLWLAHQEELLEQAERAIKRQVPGAKLGYEMGGQRAKREHQVIFSTPQTLSGARGAQLLHSLRERLILLVIDEAHRSPAATYRHIIHTVRGGYSRARILGLTATPNRTDKVTLADLYDEITAYYSTRDAIFDGYLASPRGYRITTKTSLSGVSMRGGDFAEGELGRRLNTNDRNALGLRAWREYAAGTKTLGFCAGIDHAQSCADLFNDAGVPSAIVHGKMPKPERKRIFAAFRAGEYLALFGDKLFVEGFDDAAAMTALFMRVSKSAIYYQQALGRVLRPSDDVAGKLATSESREERLRLIEGSAKPFARVIDLVDLNANGIMELATLFAPKLAEGRSPRLRELPQPEEPVKIDDVDVKSVGIRTIERDDALHASEIVIEPFDVLAAESALATADAKSPFVWHADKPGQRRLLLPRIPIGILPDGTRSKAYEYAYAAAYDLSYSERLQRAQEADARATMSVQDTTLTIVATGAGEYRVLETYKRRNQEPITRELGTGTSANDAVAIAQRHIVEDYRHLIKLLDKQAPWRAKPARSAQKEQLRLLGLDPEAYPTRGEATDAIAHALAQGDARAS